MQILFGTTEPGSPECVFRSGGEEDPRKQPNMQEEDLLITPSTGLAFEFKSGGDQMKASDLTSAASKSEATMQFRIKCSYQLRAFV